MRITKRQLKRIILEALGQYEDDLEGRLMKVWDIVRADTLESLGGQANWEEIAEEVMASGYSIDPDLIETINLLSWDDQNKLFQKAFGKGSTW